MINSKLQSERQILVTTPIVTQIEEAVQNVPGWCPIDQLLQLFTLANASANLDGDILELGSWCGRSAIAMGMAIQSSGGSKLHCVDLFPEKKDWHKTPDGDYSLAVDVDNRNVVAYAHGGQTVWAEAFERDISPVYEQFKGTLEAFNYYISKNGLSALAKPFKGDLQSFIKMIPIDFKIRMAFIDGDHNYHAVAKDIEIIEKYLVPGAWICFDDAFSNYPGVNKAIELHIIDSGKYSHYQQMTRKFFVARFIGNS